MDAKKLLIFKIFIPNILVASTLGWSSLPILAAPTMGCGQNQLVMSRKFPRVPVFPCPRVSLNQLLMTTPPIVAGIRQVTVGESAPVTIPLSPGHGVNISFIPTGEIIEKVWLDDPSWVVLDVDGCLQNLTRGECSSATSSVLHLRRIERLDIQGLPITKTSQLTVVTRSPKTLARRVNVFRLTRGDASPEYHTVEVVHRATLNRNQPAVDSAAIERGRLVAIQQRWLEESGSLDRRIKAFITQLRTQSVEEALRSAGISMELVSRLEELGNQHSLPPGLPQESLQKPPQVLQVQ